MQRTPSATFLPRMMSAATCKSSSRPLVQEPMTTWSILTSPLSSTVLVFSGRWGKATVGRRLARSMTTSSSYAASGSAAKTTGSLLKRPLT